MRIPSAKRHRQWTVVISAAATLIACLGLARMVTARRAGVYSEIVEAAHTMRYRPLQSRLHGRFPYRPLRSTTRGPVAGNGDATGRARLLSLSLRLLAADENERDLHALGITYLLVGRLDDAIESLEGALRRDAAEDDVVIALQKSRDADLIIDLAAAYLERARKTQGALDRITALEAAQRAWLLARGPESAWNRALAFEDLHFRDATIEAWGGYLRLDGGSEWSAEAQIRLADVRHPTMTEAWGGIKPRLEAIARDPRELGEIVARFPLQMRIHAEDVLLPKWCDTDDETAWRTLRRIGEALSNERGEHLVRYVVAEIEAASPERRRNVKSAYQRYIAAKRQYEMRRPSAALPELLAASRAFVAEGFPALASLSDVSASGAMFFLERYADSFDTATRGLERAAAVDTPPSLIARLEWTRGLCHLALARPYEALRSYDAALTAAERSGELDFVAALQNLRGEALESIGDFEGGLAWRLKAVQTKSVVGGRSKTEQILGGVARALVGHGRVYAALQIVDVVIAHPEFGDAPDFASEVLLLHSLILEQLGRDDHARASLARAREYASRSGDVAVNAATLADIDAAMALNDARSEPPPERIARLTAALDHAQRTSNHYHRSRFFLHRARAWRDAGDDPAAEKDLRAALAEVERQRQVPPREIPALYFASVRDVVTELVDLLLERTRIGEAFDVAEQARAHGLLHASGFTNESQKPLSHGQTMAALARNETLVSNLALTDRVVTWVISRGSIRFSESAPGRRGLQKLLARHNSADRAADRAVYEALMSAVDAAHIERCVFIPDPALPPILLAALRDRAGSYLIEKFPIVYAPSATAYVLSAAKADAGPRKTRVFAAAASYFDSSLFVDLEALSAAEREVERVAEIHARVTTVTGRRLTPRRFLTEAQNAEVVHFAGHAIGAASSGGAALVMAPDGDAGLLYAADIAARPMMHMRLVVLSACGVSSPRDVDARAIGSVAHAFLAAGLPAVVTAASEVDDRVTARFMSDFHQELVEKRDAAIALQSAQLAFIRSGDPSAEDPRNWATFRLYGHYEH